MMTSLTPTETETRARIRNDIRLGLPINFAAQSFIALEHLNPDRYRDAQALGPLSVLLSPKRAIDLLLSHDHSKPAVLRLPKDYIFAKTLALADPGLDLDYPGKGPLAQGDFKEAYWDILTILKQAHSLPAALILPVPIEGSESLHPLQMSDQHLIKRVSSARVPLRLAPNSDLHVFRALETDEEHYAIIIKGEKNKTPLVRVHSACFTGDCLGSLKCDCGPQLHKALAELNNEGGILLYLSQEGRGIGMANKMRAYKLQDQGYDTVEANQRLGFDDDERDFDIAGQMLKSLGISEIRLLTNNPRKVTWLENTGILVKERVGLRIEPGPENANYLATKAKKSGHYL